MPETIDLRWFLPYACMDDIVWVQHQFPVFKAVITIHGSHNFGVHTGGGTYWCAGSAGRAVHQGAKEMGGWRRTVEMVSAGI